jgi:hypothetical protein
MHSYQEYDFNAKEQNIIYFVSLIVQLIILNF